MQQLSFLKHGYSCLHALREAAYPRLPTQQRQIAKADFHRYVYDLTARGFEHLSHVQLLERHARSTGHWWHGFLTSSITSAIAIEAARRTYRYIPSHDILSRRGATLPIPFGKRTLIPDKLFAIDYGGSFRSFVLEVDRGTEPYSSEKARKSVKSMMRLYDEVWAADVAKTHYGLKCPLLVLFVFTNPHRKAKSMELLDRVAPRLAPFALFQVAPFGFPRFETVLGTVSDDGHSLRVEVGIKPVLSGDRLACGTGRYGMNLVLDGLLAG